MSADSLIAASSPSCLSAPPTDAKTAPDVASLDAVQKKDVKANVHWTYWVLAFVLSCVLFLDLTVYSFPLPFLPQHLDSLGYSSISISVVMSIILFSSIVTTLGNTIYTTQRKQFGSMAAFPTNNERAQPSSSVSNLASSLLSDQHSTREFLIFGAIIFDVVSLIIAGFYPDYATFMVARALQGAASAFSWIFSLSLITDLFPSSARGVAISMALSGTNLAEVVGPVMGGTIFHKFGLSVSFFAVAGLAGLIAVMFVASVWLRRSYGPVPVSEELTEQPQPNAEEVAATIQDILTAKSVKSQGVDIKPIASTDNGTTDEQKLQICIEMYAELEKAQSHESPIPDHPDPAPRARVRNPSQLSGRLAADRELSIPRSRSRSHGDRSPVSRSHPARGSISQSHVDRSPVSFSLGGGAVALPPLALDKLPADQETIVVAKANPNLTALQSTHSAFTDPVIIALSVAAMLVASVRTCVDIITPLYLDYQLGLDEFSVGIVFGVQAICCIVASLAAGALMNRLSPRWVIASFTVVFGCLCMVVFLRQDVIYVYLLYGSIGAAIGISNLACSQWVTDRADELPGVDTDSAMSLFNLLWFGGYAIGGVIGGLPAASDAVQQRNTLMALAAAMVAFVPMFLYLTRKAAQTKGLPVASQTQQSS